METVALRWAGGDAPGVWPLIRCDERAPMLLADVVEGRRAVRTRPAVPLPRLREDADRP